MELSVRLVCSVGEDLLCFVIHLSIRCCECLDVNKTMGEHVSICLVNRTDHLLYVCLFQLFIISGYVYSTSVTGEKLWLDRGSNPGPFADRTNTTTELPSHPVISPTILHLKATPVTLLCGKLLYISFNSCGFEFVCVFCLVLI